MPLTTGGGFGSIAAYLDIDTKKMVTGAARANSIIGQVNSSMTRMESGSLAMSTVIGKGLLSIAAVTGVVATGATVLAASFDASMRKVWSLTEASAAKFGDWKDQILELSNDVPSTAKEMGDAFYWVTSNMPDASDAERFKTLEIAERGAVGGVAELSDTVDALTQAQNAYQTTQPERFMDVMNKTVERGSITLQDYVNNQGKYIGAAALANISIEETSAAMATLTRNAVPADTAAMAINQTIMSFLKPTTEATEACQKYGVELSLSALRSKGLAGALMEISQKVPDDELATLFPNIRALKAVLPLTSTVTQQFAADLAEMGDAAGTTDRMFARNSQSIENLAKTVKGKLTNRLIELGEKILPVVARGLDTMGRMIDGKNESFNAFASIVGLGARAVWELAGALKEIWPIVLGVGAAFAGFKMYGILSGMGALGSLGGITSMEALTAKIAAATAAGSSFAPVAGSIVSALGAIALPAGAAALATGWYVKTIKDADKEAQAYYEHSIELEKGFGEQASAAQPLITQMAQLRMKLQGLTPDTLEYLQVQNQLLDVQGKVIDAYPALIEQMKLEGTVTTENIADLAKYARLKAEIAKEGGTGETGFAGDVTKQRSQFLKMSDDVSRYSTVVDDLVGQLDKWGMETVQTQYIHDAFMKSVDDGNKELKNWVATYKAGTDFYNNYSTAQERGNRQTKEQAKNYQTVQDAVNQLDEQETSWQDKKIHNMEAASTQLFKYYSGYTKMINDMKIASLEAGTAKEPVPSDLVSAMTSKDTYLRSQALMSGKLYIEKYFEGAFQGAPAELTAFSTQLSSLMQAGNFDAAFAAAGQHGGQAMVTNWVTEVAKQQATLSVEQGKITRTLVSALNSATPEVRAAAAAQTWAVIAAWGEAEPGMTGRGADLANAVADGIKNGQIPATADGQMNEAIVRMAAKLGLAGNVLSPELQALAKQLKIDLPDPNVQKVKAALDGLKNTWAKVFSGGTEKKEIALVVGATGTKETQVALEKTTKAANDLNRSKPNVKVSSNTTGAHQKFSDLLSRLQKYNGQVVTVVQIKAAIVGSGPFTAQGYTDYLTKTISGAAPVVKVGIAGGTGEVTSNALKEVLAQFGALTEGGFLYENIHKPFKEVEDAIMAITGQSGAHLAAWRALRGEYDQSAAKLEQYNAKLKTSQDNVESLQREQSKLNEEIQLSNDLIGKANEQLSKLSQIKITGETGATAKSQALQDQITSLDRERAEIKLRMARGTGTKEDYKRLYDIGVAEKELNAEKQLQDLQIEEIYARQHREIAETLDPLHGQEMTQANILQSIREQQGIVATENAKIAEKRVLLDGIAAQIKREQDAQWNLKIEIENTQKVTENLKSKIDEFANYFVTRYQEMISAAQELAKEQEKALKGGTATVDTEYKANPTFQHPADLVKYINQTLSGGLQPHTIPLLAPLPDVGAVTGRSGGGMVTTHDSHNSKTEVLQIENVNVYGAQNLDEVTEQCRQAKLAAQVK